jgi:ABC-type molybdate transport system substrate-binding protein
LAVTRFAPLTVVFCLLLIVGLVGCGSSKNDAGASITVFAADALKGPFTDLANRFKADNPGASVAVTYGNSADQVVELVKGTRADVFAPGDPNDMVKADQAELLNGKPVAFARQDPGGIYSVAVLKDAPQADLARKFVDLITGEAGHKTLTEAGFDSP